MTQREYLQTLYELKSLYEAYEIGGKEYIDLLSEIHDLELNEANRIIDINKIIEMRQA